LLGETEGNYEKPLSGYLVSGLRLNQGPPEYEVGETFCAFKPCVWGFMFHKFTYLFLMDSTKYLSPCGYDEKVGWKSSQTVALQE
jgi:hypothetical protein